MTQEAHSPKNIEQQALRESEPPIYQMVYESAEQPMRHGTMTARRQSENLVDPNSSMGHYEASMHTKTMTNSVVETV